MTVHGSDQKNGTLSKIEVQLSKKLVATAGRLPGNDALARP